jgi:hypothetical protein
LLITLTAMAGVLIRAWLGQDMLVVVSVAIMVEVVGGAIVGLAFRDAALRIAKQVIATYPDECWSAHDERRRDDDYIHE